MIECQFNELSHIAPIVSSVVTLILYTMINESLNYSLYSLYEIIKTKNILFWRNHFRSQLQYFDKEKTNI